MLFICLRGPVRERSFFFYYVGTCSHLKQIKAAFIDKMLVGVFGYRTIYVTNISPKFLVW